MAPEFPSPSTGMYTEIIAAPVLKSKSQAYPPPSPTAPQAHELGPPARLAFCHNLWIENKGQPLRAVRHSETIPKRRSGK
jgi:hypothetical protein